MGKLDGKVALVSGAARGQGEAEARQFLSLLSGRRHRVITAVAVAAPSGTVGRREVITTVTFKRLGRREMDWYLQTGEVTPIADSSELHSILSNAFPQGYSRPSVPLAAFSHSCSVGNCFPAHFA